MLLDALPSREKPWIAGWVKQGNISPLLAVKPVFIPTELSRLICKMGGRVFQEKHREAAMSK
jgi:hypothetical protein